MVRQPTFDLSGRVALVTGSSIDRDILDEEARGLLGRVAQQDLVIMLPRASR